MPAKIYLPADLRLESFSSGSDWVRIHQCAQDPLFFGKTGWNRFDAPDRKEFGVLYMAKALHGALIETLQLTHDRGFPYVTSNFLRIRCFCRIVSTEEIRLVNLTSGASMAWLGVNGSLNSGDRSTAQRWSQAVFQHPDKPDGILYVTRHDPQQVAVALFDRAQCKVYVSNRQEILDPTGGVAVEIDQVLREYGIEISMGSGL